MLEPLLNRIRELEIANRRWKTLCAVLSVMLLAVLLVGGGFTGFYGYRALLQNQQALEARDRALMMEMVAREQAEVARQAAEKAMQQPAAEKK